MRVVIEFYQSLYKLVELEYSGIEGIDWQPIEGRLRDWLERHSNKVPGSDGFILVVFQSQWEVIKQDSTKVLQEFRRDGIINGLTNETYICLIPKKISSRKVKDFRLISLVTSLYKIIFKVLSLSLKHVLEDYC
ncbi:hypothetical protein PanWU01x14_108520 [Parasponia andersonii]|uniref:Endonuclease/exonuclease/phosphatase n=1 Tax=Parasponia andersonii TaxID=3476 RepID=A0A2P5CZY2_PARAD|nr:hypothetical protein PanWU01x14_108520 [Parasponia andersonii]